MGFLYYGVILAVSIVFTERGGFDGDEANDFTNEDGMMYRFDYAAIFLSASAEIVESE